MAKQKVHLIMVLDCSSSMGPTRGAVVQGFNSALNEWKALDKTKLFVTRLDFSKSPGLDPIRVVWRRESAKKVGGFDLESYTTDGITNMLDAVGQAISIGTEDTASDSVVVVILSDGAENASSTHTYQTIAELISNRMASGKWTFAYVGANQDLATVSTRMSIPMANTLSYTSSVGGTSEALSKLTRSLGIHYASGRTSTSAFFSEKDERLA